MNEFIIGTIGAGILLLCYFLNQVHLLETKSKEKYRENKKEYRPLGEVSYKQPKFLQVKIENHMPRTHRR